MVPASVAHTQREKEGQGPTTPEPSKVPMLNNRWHKYHGAPEVPTMSYTGYYYWTQTDIAFLKKHYPSPHVTAAEVAAKLGRTRNAVFLKANRLGIRKEELKWE